MKKRYLITALVSAACLLNACSKQKDEIDTTYPEIDITAADAFPKQCSVIKRGEKMVFRALLRDNAQLGSLSVDIHHNFDHHSHSTEVNDCGSAPVKTPVNPFLLIKDYPLPTGLTSYQTAIEIAVPADIDTGDYHFLVRLTDKEGWQTIRGLSIKITE